MFFNEHPSYRLYGEWLVPHTLKSYREDAWRRFWIFDVFDDEIGQYIPYEIYAERLELHKLDYIPPSNIIKSPTEEQLLHIVNSNTFLIQDGAGAGEGIVIKNYDYQNKFGRQTWSKLVRNEFKEANKKAFGLKEQDGRIQIESQIAEKYVTEALVNKTRAKIINEGTTDRRSLIPRLLQTVFHDLVQEEIWNILKEHRNPTIDFGKLNRFVIHCTKNWAKDLF
jgi:ATP-dependent RNA circularization protein (DNA/RNA ligase family)